MTRAAGALPLALGITGAALVFGSRPLGVAGVGLLLAAGLGRLWAGFARGPVSALFASSPARAREGERVQLRIEVKRASRVPVGSATVVGNLGRLGPFECRLHGKGRKAIGELDLGQLPRGRFSLTDAELVLTDVLGLETVSLPLDAPVAVVVEPRLVDLRALFNESGALLGDGRRLLLRRQAGFDFHSVREYERGESLRRVHWPTTARRGQLMVKELEDAPRDEVAVILDCDPAGAVGEPPDASFDVAVRAAGSIVRLMAKRGRRAKLLTTGAAAAVVDVTSLAGDFRAVLSELAAAEPDALYRLGASIGSLRALAGAGELVVVTSALDHGGAEALLSAATRRAVSLVWVDAASYAGRPTRADPSVLRLAGAGIPTAVVRRGDDLAAALDIRRNAVTAHA